MSSSERFPALDVFRGMTICFMIIVNTAGDSSTTFSPLLHASWHGFTPTDLVFPSFLFAVGNALSFVMVKWNNMGQVQVLMKILKRTILIFLLGFLMYWFPFVQYNDAGQLVFSPFENTRIFGVLQRIALCYGITAVMIYYLKPKLTVIITCIILILYWIIMMYYGAAPDPLAMTANAGYRLDLWLLGEKHLYHGEGVAFDPEGLLSTFPAIGNVVIGYLAGSFIQKKGKTFETLAKLLLAGFVLITVAYFWDLVFPINKKLWTSSFVLYTTGLDCVILATIMYVIDFLKKTRWTYFFQVFGKNPLSIYLLSEILAILLYFFHTNSGSSWYRSIYKSVFSRFGGYAGSLLFAVSFMLTCWLVGWWMDKRKIYIRV
jgi:predicted acyltransferase